MFPNLFEATHQYWRQLDEIESRYQQGDLSIEEVDKEVEMLMKQLGQKRRESLRFFRDIISNWISTHTEFLIGFLFVLMVAYSWMLTINN
ncbi:hypothetical protein [Crocosphaera sp. Alani8]|uniref:hypothetical protein n=1 Tax=Crocosphaera sp. Alani8 TaxID=3038952 RepID=UPI00313B9A18